MVCNLSLKCHVSLHVKTTTSTSAVNRLLLLPAKNDSTVSVPGRNPVSVLIPLEVPEFVHPVPVLHCYCFLFGQMDSLIDNPDFCYKILNELEGGGLPPPTTPSAIAIIL